MSDSLRDQLLGLGFKPTAKPAAKPVSKPAAKPASGAKPASRPATPKAGHGSRRHAADGKRNRPDQRQQPTPEQNTPKRDEIDLGKAYAIRAQQEKEERIQAEREKQEAARQRREAKAKLAELLKDKALNAPDAEIARHFPYGGKIKRIYVTPGQLKQLNAGALGVVQLDGRYLLVEAEILLQAESIFAPAVAVKVDPDAPAQDDPYTDPQYQVPDDLVW